jgi:hypothetical protein
MRFENEIDPERRKKANHPRHVGDLRAALEGLPDKLPLVERYEVIVTTVMNANGPNRDKLALAIREDF